MFIYVFCKFKTFFNSSNINGVKIKIYPHSGACAVDNSALLTFCNPIKSGAIRCNLGEKGCSVSLVIELRNFYIVSDCVALFHLLNRLKLTPLAFVCCKIASLACRIARGVLRLDKLFWGVSRQVVHCRPMPSMPYDLAHRLSHQPPLPRYFGATQQQALLCRSLSPLQYPPTQIRATAYCIEMQNL